MHGDAAALGELHRVAGEIDDHLAQVMRVAAHRRRHFRHDRDDELDGLGGGLSGDDATGAVDECMQVEIRLLEHHLARLDLREVEHVVH